MVDQMSQGNEARARKMFGDYGLYCNGRFVGVICNDQMFLKITDRGKALLADADKLPPYDGARPHLLVPEDVIDDAGRLSDIAGSTASALPPPKPKKPKAAGSRAT